MGADHTSGSAATYIPTMTPEQQKEAMKSMGAYYGLQTRLGIKSFMDEAKKAFESLPSFLEGFGDGFSEE